MKPRIGSLVLTALAFFSAAHLTAQVHLSSGSAEELADQLRQQGWHDVSPGVLQRELPNRIETITVGKEGLGHAIQELRQHVATVANAYRKNPSAELKQSLESMKNRLTEMEKSVVTLKSEQAAAEPPPDCVYMLNCYAEAFPLYVVDPDLDGVGASAVAQFWDTLETCRFSAQVLAYAEGGTDDPEVPYTYWEVSQTDLDSSSPTRPFVGATAKIMLGGVPLCDSAALAWIYLPIQQLYYSCIDSNNLCLRP